MYGSELTADHLSLVWCSRKAAFNDRRGCFEKPRRGGLVAEQRLDFSSEDHISFARLLQERTALLGRTFQRPMVEVRDPIAAFGSHNPRFTGSATSANPRRRGEVHRQRSEARTGRRSW